MEDNFNTNKKLFSDFSVFHNLYLDIDRRTKFFLKLKPFLFMDDLELATKLGDIHLTIILYLERRKKQYNNELQNNFIKELLGNTQVSKLSISTQTTRPDLDNHFATPSNCDDVIVAAPIHNELIEPNHFAAQTVTYDQPLPKMEKHQTDENCITSNRKRKKKRNRNPP
ncbi:unnamed protein product [Rhizophagus irregularis]|nr:unnamed protein product [Rhizophagus irregularis]